MGWAFMWTKLRVVVLIHPMAPRPSNAKVTRLPSLKKEHGKWLLARDGNLLARVPRLT